MLQVTTWTGAPRQQQQPLGEGQTRLEPCKGKPILGHKARTLVLWGSSVGCRSVEWLFCPYLDNRIDQS